MSQCFKSFAFLIALSCVGLTGCQSLRPSSCSLGGQSKPACDACSESCDYIPDCVASGCDSGCDNGSCDGQDCDGHSCDGMGFGQIVRGGRVTWLDRTGSRLGFANKLALWDRRADNHDVSPQTESAVVGYLQQNGLGNTLVRVNQYAPIDEWRRLTQNKRIAAPWRYTFGTYDWLKYTLLPGRLVGGDWYNPFTDSVHLYSDIPAIGLAKAAYAKDVHSRTLPGTYASFQDTPIIGLYHEKKANDEVVSYLQQHGGRDDLEEAERILYPDFSGALGAQLLGFLPYGSVYGRATGALAGHAVREVKSRTVGFRMPE